MIKYTLNDLQKDFPDDKACLDWLMSHRYPEGITCKLCGKITTHHFIDSRKSYSCQECGHHVHPTANTIFEKSATPLTKWFYAIYLMASTRTGIAAKQLERELGVTYKTAWRMFTLIRSRLDDENGDPFGGEDKDVEVDETYVGGKRQGKRGRGAKGKTPVVGIVERKGQVKAVVVPDVKSETVLPIVHKTVAKYTRVHTDEFQIYNRLKAMGYDHNRILHSSKIYVMGNVHTNTIEGFWAQVKNAVRGVHHGVKPKYLQWYVNEYCFRYNHRGDTTPMFRLFLLRTSSALD